METGLIFVPIFRAKDREDDDRKHHGQHCGRYQEERGHKGKRFDVPSCNLGAGLLAPRPAVAGRDSNPIGLERTNGENIDANSNFTIRYYYASFFRMNRRKTVSELRSEIMASEKLKAESQEAISIRLKLNQATVSRILSGKFKRPSSAVTEICRYASISCITNRPLGELEASIHRLTDLAKGSAPHRRHAVKLIRLAAELLETDIASSRVHRRGRATS